MRKIIPLLLILAVIIPTFASGEDYGFIETDSGEAWYVTGTVGIGEFFHSGSEEMMEYYYATLSPEAYEFLYWLIEDIDVPPGEHDTACEVMIFSFEEDIDLGSYLYDQITFTGDAFEWHTIYHQRHIVVYVTDVLDASSLSNQGN